MKLEQFKEVWVLDFEFGEKDPGIPRPLCLVAKELNQNKKIRLWLDEQGGADSPFKISGDVLLVAYFATAELSCFLELGWEFPENLLDLYESPAMKASVQLLITCSVITSFQDI